ncbi:hypothetical protein ACFL35_17030 [Candidatus Riflebacteria bacterium]
MSKKGATKYPGIPAQEVGSFEKKLVDFFGFLPEDITSGAMTYDFDDLMKHMEKITFKAHHHLYHLFPVDIRDLELFLYGLWQITFQIFLSRYIKETPEYPKGDNMGIDEDALDTIRAFLRNLDYYHEALVDKILAEEKAKGFEETEINEQVKNRLFAAFEKRSVILREEGGIESLIS